MPPLIGQSGTSALNNVVGIKNQVTPKEGPRVLPVSVDLSVGDGDEVSLSLTQVLQQGILSMMQAIYIDNADIADAFVILVKETNQRIVCPPNSQGFFPLIASGQAVNLTMQSTATSGIVTLLFLNMPFPASVWSVL